MYYGRVDQLIVLQILSNTNGFYNSFFGGTAGFNTTGGGNSFFGYASGWSNTAGVLNSFFGYQAGIDTKGSFNSFFGSGAGAWNTSGVANVFVGQNAGNTNITGSNNTIIGTNADVGTGALTFATAIGSGAVVSTSNRIALGRANGSDLVQIFGLGAGGVVNLCLNPTSEISARSSSLRYKTNIAPFTFGLNLVKRLRPITFDWKDGGMHDLGLGAEDVAAIEPLLVTYNKAGQVEGVKYDRIRVVLLNAVKEQQTQIERQQQQITELRGIVCALKPDAAVCK